ncbi:hypothetical protein [Candidatus Ichthyocystis sparus]|uniref:hypothetical protein n=1 Tax=Candidatus Ichthyocystis sparus TaxID=1561004 RepID=UPI001146FEC3|nr:hypothetical protein [Candidatus Ichthyocystis sparus]
MIDSSSGLRTAWCDLKLTLCSLMYARDRFDTLSSELRFPFDKVNITKVFLDALIGSGLSLTPSLPLSVDDYTNLNYFSLRMHQNILKMFLMVLTRIRKLVIFLCEY